MTEIDASAYECFNRPVLNSQLERGLPDDLVDGLMHLPRNPALPLFGNLSSRVLFPKRTDIMFRRIWACIPSRHKEESTRVISPEAFRVIYNSLEVWLLRQPNQR